ncbi:MAG: YtfJ family protein [Myxococcaceae bacterium]
MTRATRTATIASVSCLLLLAAAARADSVQTLDADVPPLKDTAGKVVPLTGFKGKPTVLIYEDRTSTEQNRKLKDELWRRGHESGLLDAAHVVGVANLSSYDFWPARTFAQSHIQKLEKKVGIPVLIDWKGAMESTPWNLPSGSSTVLVFDSDGKLVFSHSGALSDAQTEELIGKLSTMIGVVAKPRNPHG